jgi:hypothetical protein
MECALMANQVYANNMEISCKAAAGKSICAFPDVCFTPPQTPATPPGVPIPYPNTGMASDCTDGSSTVKISGKEVMLKNKSYFKKSTGDEAGCAPKKGVVTSKNTGKIYFTMWSMDVKVEGENVVRNLDMSTHNHGSMGPNTPPWTYLDSMAVPPADHPCKDQIIAAQNACKNTTPSAAGRDCSGTDCEKCMACILVPKDEDKRLCCAPNNTGHHLIEDHWLKGNSDFPDYRSDRESGTFKKQSLDRRGDPKIITVAQAPCVCANESRSVGTIHRRLHDVQGAHEESHMPGGGRDGQPWNYAAGKKAALEAHEHVFKGQKCNDNDCMEKQLDGFYGDDGNRMLNPPHKQALGSQREPMANQFGQDA